MKCPRVQCPPLECDEKIAFRPDKKACCRQCPVTTPRSNTTTTALSDIAHLPRDQALPSTRRTAEEILSSGGCKYPLGGPYENGMEWHPRVHSHGEMKCVKCRCKVRIYLQFIYAIIEKDYINTMDKCTQLCATILCTQYLCNCTEERDSNAEALLYFSYRKI